MDLGLGALHIPPLFTGLKVLPPASIFHLPGQEEVAGLIYFCTSSPVERARGLEHDALVDLNPLYPTLTGCLRSWVGPAEVSGYGCTCLTGLLGTEESPLQLQAGYVGTQKHN